MGIVEVETVAYSLAPDQGPVPAVFSYDPADPYTVTITFHSGDGVAKPWEFARQLLTGALNGPVGTGDVRLWPTTDALIMLISSPEGSALLRLCRSCTTRFITASRLAVPEGAEHVDVDAVIADILEEAQL